MLHPHTELRHVSEAIGMGVFATRDIPRGTIVWVLDELDQKLPVERVQTLGPRYDNMLDRYAYPSASGDLILCWDLARFVNHSCDANAVSTGWELDVAARDIAAGEELCNDYAVLNLDRSFTCRCGAPRCRRTVRPDDFERLADCWDERARDAFSDVLRVVQPLWKWVPQKRRVSAAARDPRRLPSVRQHRWGSATGPGATPFASVAGAAG